MGNPSKESSKNGARELLEDDATSEQPEILASIDKTTASFENLSTTASATTLKDLKPNYGIWYRLHVLIFNLRNDENMEASRARLELVTDPYYIGSPYFTPSEAAIIKLLEVSKNGDNQTKTHEEVIKDTLEERLERRRKKRVESGDLRVCAAHDVSPILEKAMGIREMDPDQRQGVLGIRGEVRIGLGR